LGAVGEISKNLAEELTLMIGPIRNTILHVTSRNCDFTERIDKIIQEGRDVKFPIPFIENLFGDTPLHEALSEDYGD